eukprot:c30687_g1_i1 orf=211-540(+)
MAYQTTGEEEGRMQQVIPAGEHHNLGEMFANQTAAEEEARKQGRYGGKEEQQHQQQQKESPYTDYKSEGEYVKAGYGAEGYEPREEPPKDYQPDHYSEPTNVAPVSPKA